MAFTQTDRDTVAAALATGAKTVQFSDGRRVEYQTGADLRATLAAIDAELAGASASATPRVAYSSIYRG